jgi:hypothetical protein
MKRTHIRSLSDEELRPQLEAGDIIFFLGPKVKFQEIERQVERLGFGDLYIVSATKGGGKADRAKIRLKPEASGAWCEVAKSWSENSLKAA